MASAIIAPEFEALCCELESRWRRPAREQLTSARTVALAEPDAERAFIALRQAGLFPDPPEGARRAFLADRSPRAEVKRSLHRARPIVETPPRELAVLLAADPDGFARAEALALAAHRALTPWAGASPEDAPLLIWGLCGGPTLSRSERSSSPKPIDYGVSTALHEAQSSLQSPEIESIDTQCWNPRPWPAFSSALLHLRGAWSWQKARSGPSRERFEQLPDPFAPLVELATAGYELRRMNAHEILLCAPHPPARAPGALRHSRDLQNLEDHRLQRIIDALKKGQVERLRALLAPTFNLSSPALTSPQTLLDSLCDLEDRPREDRRSILTALDQAHLLMDAHDTWGFTALQRATLGRSPNTLEDLLWLGADPNRPDARGERPLHSAIRWDSAALVPLLEAGASVDGATLDGQTPLYQAAKRGNERAARTLLRWSANPNARTTGGKTPLHAAASAQRADSGFAIARLLLRAGAKAHYDQLGTSPADIARLAGRQALVELLDYEPGPPPELAEPPAEHWPPALERSLLEDPKDADAWLVLADWLQAQGDKRGELIALQHTAPSRGLKGWSRGQQLRAMQNEGRTALAEQVGATLEGPVYQHAPLIRLSPNMFCSLKHGFVHHAQLGIGMRASAELIHHLPKPIFRFLHSLDLTSWSTSPSLAALLRSAGPLEGLRKLTLRMTLPTPEDALEHLARFCPRLETLVLLCRFETTLDISHPTLRTLVLRRTTRLPPNTGHAWRLTPKLPAVNRLDLDANHRGSQDLLSAMLPSLPKGLSVRFKNLGAHNAEPSWMAKSTGRVSRLELVAPLSQSAAFLGQNRAPLRGIERIRVFDRRRLQPTERLAKRNDAREQLALLAPWVEVQR